MASKGAEQNQLATGVSQRQLCLRDYLADDSGQAATEYILVIGLVAIVLIVGYNQLQDGLRSLLKRISGYLNGPGI